MSLTWGLNEGHPTGHCWSLWVDLWCALSRACSSAMCCLVDNPINRTKPKTGNKTFLKRLGNMGCNQWMESHKMPLCQKLWHSYVYQSWHFEKKLNKIKSNSGITQQWRAATVLLRPRHYSMKSFLKSQKWIYLFICLFIACQLIKYLSAYYSTQRGIL